ncbi:large ribosomal subunit protein bL27m-like [Ornithodoros turicata]|uniref:large ribosomal subunit protein bL27m-like n=1 Tax=Ornithodoros turicata TaxID=34597 RepID=UPI0031391C59
MASILGRLIAFLPQRPLLGAAVSRVESVRGAAKGNKACHQRKPRKGKHYGIKKWPGTTVHMGDMLVKQRIMRFHPGLNVEFGVMRHSLYAAVDGKVVVSTERVTPRWDNPRVQEFYEGQDVTHLHKKYFHVVPEPQPQVFNLVAQV